MRARRLTTAVAVTVLALLGSGCSREVSIEPPRPSATGAGTLGREAQRTLDALEEALREGDPAASERLAAPGAEDLLASVQANATALRVTELDLRYVDEGPPLTENERARLGQDAWRGRVALTYRYGGFDKVPARVETEFVFAHEGARAQIAAIGGDVRTPLWLVARLSVVRTGRTLVAVAGDAGRYPALVARAVRQVQRLLTSWRGPLVVEVPRTREELDRALQATPGQYDNIAAVTTTADGALDPGAPVRILINPGVFEKLQRRGAQVVVSHEATHAALAAPFSSMPTWLLEGFADYVALDDAGVPVPVAAGQILRRIRKEGLPDDLPTSDDLSPTATGLGATYEEAWLACRFLAQEYGAAAILRFYRAVDAGSSTEEAFRSVLGTTQRQFVTAWRKDLARLAGVAG